MSSLTLITPYLHYGIMCMGLLLTNTIKTIAILPKMCIELNSLSKKENIQFP